MDASLTPHAAFEPPASPKSTLRYPEVGKDKLRELAAVKRTLLARRR